jgi:hypothetical protein
MGQGLWAVLPHQCAHTHAGVLFVIHKHAPVTPVPSLEVQCWRMLHLHNLAATAQHLYIAI